MMRSGRSMVQMGDWTREPALLLCEPTLLLREPVRPLRMLVLWLCVAGTGAAAGCSSPASTGDQGVVDVGGGVEDVGLGGSDAQGADDAVTDDAATEDAATEDAATEDAAAGDTKPGGDADAASSGWAANCYSCHGTKGADNPAPPHGTNDELLTTEAPVGAHQNHLAASSWHRRVQCADCHVVPAKTPHANDVIDFLWSGPAVADGAQPAFSEATLTCASVACHGTQLLAPPAGQTVLREPVWTQVDGTFNACGQACHSTPPGAPHPARTDCATCHGAVIASFDPATGAATWADAARHVDGQVDVVAMTCTTCHGNAQNNDPAPPLDVAGQTQTSAPGVGAHQAHVQASGWHKQVECGACHEVPTQPLHANGVDDVAFAGLALAQGATPAFDATALSCNSVYCHGTTLLPAKPGASIAQVPVWTQVDGSFNACGQACHSTPPGGTHPDNPACQTCHGSVIASFDMATGKATWADPSKHIDGIIQAGGYHTLAGWAGDKLLADGSVNPEHHGISFFLGKQMTDDKGANCTSCHGADLDGGTANISCNNDTVQCHGKNAASNGSAGNWKACGFCHGGATQVNPPAGVWNEQTQATMAVGAHAMHLQSTSTHVALACDRCHIVPADGDIAHTQQYVPSTDLQAAGHHGDVTLPPPPAVAWNTGVMTWSEAAVKGNPVTARGTCTGACHSNGRGAGPAVTAYWAGGTWTAGTCSGCHAAKPATGRHGKHTSGGNNIACAVCHADASSATHVNGVRDVYATIVPNTGTGNITTSRPTTGTCANKVSCTGTCHGETHSQECWK